MSTPKRIFSMYALLDPESRKVRYIGKTQQPLHVRRKRHLRDAQERSEDKWTDNTHRANWIRSLLSIGKELEMYELCRYETLEEVNKAEMFFIYHIRAVDPHLTNATAGGDGCIVPRKPAVSDDLVVKAYTAGVSSTKIAKQYKTCKKRVLSVLKKHGVLRPRW